MTATLSAPVAPPRTSSLARDVGIVMVRELRRLPVADRRPRPTAERRRGT